MGTQGGLLSSAAVAAAWDNSLALILPFPLFDRGGLVILERHFFFFIFPQKMMYRYRTSNAGRETKVTDLARILEG
jgi:nitrate reductase gamma subunit